MVSSHIVKTILVLTYVSTMSTSLASTNSSCPTDLDYVGIIPWDYYVCQNKNKMSDCCNTLSRLYSVSLARYLQETSYFRFHDLPTSIACLSKFQEKLDSFDLPSNLTSICFNPLDYTNSTNQCANIYDLQDWHTTLGPENPLDTQCRPGALNQQFCEACAVAGLEVKARLLAIDGNQAHDFSCLLYAVLYGAGMGYTLGPGSEGALSCIFGLSLLNQADSETTNRKKTLILSLLGSFSSIVIICFVTGLYVWRKKLKTNSTVVADIDLETDENECQLEWTLNTRVKLFSIQELEKATNKFSRKNFIGEGLFSIVHKGKLPDGTLIAVKKIMSSETQGQFEFRNEVEIISTLKHRNLVNLIGYSLPNKNVGNEKYVVYEYMPNGSLSEHIFCPKQPLAWPQRKGIILDVANALAYLHYGVKPTLYHRDIKATNILLSADFRAKVADFGLVKENKEGNVSHFPTKIAGTRGYLAPEYAIYGQLTEKSDVYSFGIVILETLCGRKVVLESCESQHPTLITEWAWSFVKSGKIEEVLDPVLVREVTLADVSRRQIMERFVLVGILCAHLMVAVRPTIIDALKMLEGDIEIPVIPDRASYADEIISVCRKR